MVMINWNKVIGHKIKRHENNIINIQLYKLKNYIPIDKILTDVLIYKHEKVQNSYHVND